MNTSTQTANKRESKTEVNKGGPDEMARHKRDEGILKDGRTAPIFIHSVIDDMTGLSPNTMRVYMHLARRADKSGAAWPSYQSIGDHCFSSVSENPATRKSFARKAIDQLIEAQLLVKENRARDDGGQTSNVYVLVNPPCLLSTPMPIKHPPMPIDTPRAYKAPEDTPLEDTSIEDTPVERSSSSSASSNPPEKSKDDDDDDLAFKSVLLAWNEGMADKATNHIQDKLKELIAECGADAVIHGIMATVEVGGRSLKYVVVCTRNHVDAAQRRDAVNVNEPPRKTGYSIYNHLLSSQKEAQS